MAKKRLELTWDKRSQRWKKVYKGKQLYFPFGNGKSDTEGYKKALAAWHEKKAEIDSQKHWDKPNGHQYQHAIDTRNDLIQWYESQGEFSQASKHRQEIADLRKQYDLRKTPPALSGYDLSPLYDDDFLLIALAGADDEMVRLTGDPPAIAMSIWLDRLSTIRKPQDDAQTIGKAIAEFNAFKRSQADMGDVSAGWAINVESRLKHVAEFCGAMPLESLSAKTVSQWHTFLTSKVKDETFSADYASHLFKGLTVLIKWLWENEKIDTLPRNLDKLSIGKPTKQVGVFYIDELKAFIENASDRTKLYLLLMANTGMTQADISDLKQNEVDWQEGRIVRKRSKTSQHENVPIVNYKLWDETFRLLKQFRSDDAESVLINANGNPLRYRDYKPSGKAINIDNVKNAYDRLTKKLKIEIPKPLKLIRKTSASLLEKHETYGRYAQFFLGQSPKSVAEKHYIQPSTELFDKALAWLGNQYGFNTK